MPLARKLAELLGGGVSVVSEPGIGSTFTVSIPRIYGARASPKSPRATPRPPSRGA